MIKLRSLAIMASAVVMVSSCREKEPDPEPIPNEEELITTLQYRLTSVGGGSDVVFTFQDLDGDGGDDPIITTGTLMANTSYTGEVILLNEQANPAEDITVEIRGEADEHQFFYASSLPGLMVSYEDADANGHPIGLQTSVTTDAPGSGTLRVTLRHQPDKSAAGVAAGDISNAGGETDIEVDFDVEIR